MNADDVVKGVIELLKTRHQLGLLPEVAERLHRAALSQGDPDLALVEASSALSVVQKKRLKQTLTKVFNQPVTIKTKFNKDLIGGIRITLAGKVIDLSLDKQLSDINEVMIYD